MMHEEPVPDTGADNEEVYVVAWLVQPGERVAVGDVIVEVMTDKANFEITATVSGVLVAQLAGAEERIAVGDPIARIESD